MRVLEKLRYRRESKSEVPAHPAYVIYVLAGGPYAQLRRPVSKATEGESEKRARGRL